MAGISATQACSAGLLGTSAGGWLRGGADGNVTSRRLTLPITGLVLGLGLSVVPGQPKYVKISLEYYDFATPNNYWTQPTGP